ncbi:uncharacterized protein LOC133793717 [Humulus lupulus]|uniref:uncharacterized protein LOC133793717 n=1 Tax=Humulus lupulus TaxID=3486 RepID=UPI002B409297|nr:uncharacterized protein LOC133793717 [Humulus lupulus]
MLWRKAEKGRLMSYSFNHIDIALKLENHPEFRLTGFYGEPQRSLRHNSWRKIKQLAGASELPWCLIGDLNNVLYQWEKRGGRAYPRGLITGFQETLTECGLSDMEMMGHPYTWERGRGTPNWIEVRLDRALISQPWRTIFYSAKLVNLEISVSDHSPIWLDLAYQVRDPVIRRFRFENAWVREPMCRQIVSDHWRAYSVDSFQEKIKCCSTALAEWGKDITGKFKERISHCNRLLKQLKGQRDEESVRRYQEIHSCLFEVLTQKEIFWRQRSKQLWLQAGDQNTKFFHACASTRKRINQLTSLKDDHGTWVDWEHGLGEVIVDYFRNIFASSTTAWDSVIECVPESITEEINLELLLPVDDSEVKEALFQMHPDKSPGPDGFNPGFYQKFWDIVGPDVVRLVQHFFMFAEFPDHLNQTHIVLNPKKSKPETMSDLRPIALCNVIYKIVSKVVANRLKKFLHNIISETQSAFIPGKLITDNIMVSFEVMHYLKRKSTGKEGFMAIKLDMSKAYDRVEWGFLHAMLKKMGFSDHWIKIVMRCVSSVSYKVISGCHELGPIILSRGLRQGDPLSPYLFIICAEGFSALISDYERRGKLQACKVARGAPTVSHMFFADDSYLYCKATESATNSVMELLGYFQLASGQQVNLSKSSVFFSTNTRADARVKICDMLKVSEAGESCTYLGLPNILGRNKNTILGFLKDKMRKKIQSWEGKFLSKAGKELLIKTVAQSLPSYAMNVFLLPLGLCQEMEQLMCSYWWKSSSRNNKGIHWKSWEKLSTHKSKGGMGFCNLHDFNMALFSKQGWRLLCQPNTLVTRIFKARYFGGGNFLTAELGSNPSFIWRSIFASQEIVGAGARRKIGNGSQTSIVRDPWLPCGVNPRISTTHPALAEKKVEALMITGRVAWDEDLVRDLFNQRDANLIVGIPLHSSRLADAWFWAFESSGRLTVKSAYRYLQQDKDGGSRIDRLSFWNKLWKLRVPPKVKDLVWRASSDCLPTKVHLRLKHVDIDTTCPVCQVSGESIIHCLVECPFARASWARTGIGVCTSVEGTFSAWLESLFQTFDDEKRKVIAMTCWALWRVRNDCVWKGKVARVATVTSLANNTLDQWTKAQDRFEVPTAAFLTEADGADIWRRPAAGVIKINVDAALFSESSTYSFACVARNDQGHTLEAITCCRNGVVSPELAEAMGMREALSWIKKKSWDKVTIETDCLTVVQALRCSISMDSYFGSLITECKGLWSDVKNIKILFVKRSANNVAHALARASCHVADCTFRGGDLSPAILDVLLKDSC